MNRNFIGVGITAILILVIVIFLMTQGTSRQENGTDIPQNQTTVSPTEEEASRPTDEAAELTAFGFIQDFIAQGPPDPDLEARTRAYEALSENAKENVSKDSLGRDLALFVGVQDIPDQGASVEDLQIRGNSATLIVGLNYSGGRVLRAVNMVIEGGVYKVDSIESLDEYPPTQ